MLSSRQTPPVPAQEEAKDNTVLLAVLFGVVTAVMLGITVLWCRARKRARRAGVELRRPRGDEPSSFGDGAEEGRRNVFHVYTRPRASSAPAVVGGGERETTNAADGIGGVHVEEGRDGGETNVGSAEERAGSPFRLETIGEEVR
ncbi:Hypothetical protein D9617_7g031580 [Elsinoe fawcettii]|nr:Hypothetical protein D9617_7g031580 [Elsinoe fawcettii]